MERAGLSPRDRPTPLQKNIASLWEKPEIQISMWNRPSLTTTKSNSEKKKNTSHRPNNTVCQSDLGLPACHPAWLWICLFLWNVHLWTRKDMSLLNSQLLLISKEAPSIRAFPSTVRAHLPRAASPGVLIVKCRFLQHDCFVAEITTASKKP